jgi:Skp family chaperone for outer membrane proteins
VKTLPALALACLLPVAAFATPPILVVDLSDAYARSTALAGLLADVDSELKSLAQKYRPELDQLRRELRELKQRGPDSRDQQLAVARRISDIETAAERVQERLAQANETAIGEVQQAIARAKAELQSESGARAILDIHETHYVRPDCPCLATDRLYELLNEQLPRVELRMVRTL